MAIKNLPCGKKLGNGNKCKGELIQIDGGNSYTRVRCNKCDRVKKFQISLLQFARHLKDME